MRTAVTLGLALALGASAAGCGTPPADEIASARAALERARANVGDAAAESLRAAEDAGKALDAELAAQDAKWFKSYDRTRELAVSTSSAADKAVADAAAARERAAAALAARTKAAAEERARLRTTAVQVGRGVPPPLKTKNVVPEYPALAKSSRIGGVVEIQLTVGPDGKVADAEVIKSVPTLDQAALDAVKQWEYRPTRIKGVAVPVILNVGVNFRP